MVTLLAVTAALDNSIVARLEAWLEQRSLETKAPALASRTQAANAGAGEPLALMADAADTGAAPKEVELASRGANAHEETEEQAPMPPAMHANATRIQAQVRCLARTPAHVGIRFPKGCVTVLNIVCPVESVKHASGPACYRSHL